MIYEYGVTDALHDGSDDAARDAVKSGLLSIAEELTVQAGYAAAFKDRVYGALVHHA
jgi:hypothetical protein